MGLQPRLKPLYGLVGLAEALIDPVGDGALADGGDVYEGELVGGCDIVVEMYNSGELKELLDADAPAGADA